MIINIDIKRLKVSLLPCLSILLSSIVILQAVKIHNIKTQRSISFFLDAKLTRNQITSRTLQNLKNILEDKNISEETKQQTAAKYLEIATDANNEVRIEELLKFKGFNNVICFIETAKAKIIVDSKVKLTDQKRKLIKEIVSYVSGIKDIDIETKE